MKYHCNPPEENKLFSHDYNRLLRWCSKASSNFKSYGTFCDICSFQNNFPSKAMKSLNRTPKQNIHWRMETISLMTPPGHWASSPCTHSFSHFSIQHYVQCARKCQACLTNIFVYARTPKTKDSDLRPPQPPSEFFHSDIHSCHEISSLDHFLCPVGSLKK